jgi:hypothetical protein
MGRVSRIAWVHEPATGPGGRGSGCALLEGAPIGCRVTGKP